MKKEFDIFVGKELIYEDLNNDKLRVSITRAYDSSFRFIIEGELEERIALLNYNGKWSSNVTFHEYVKK